MASTFGLSGLAKRSGVMSTDGKHTTSSSPRQSDAVAIGAPRVRRTTPTDGLSEFEKLLIEPGRPSCRRIAVPKRRVSSRFEVAGANTSEAQAQLPPAMEMCSAHERRLIEGPGESRVMTMVMPEAFAGVRRAATT